MGRASLVIALAVFALSLGRSLAASKSSGPSSSSPSPDRTTPAVVTRSQDMEDPEVMDPKTNETAGEVKTSSDIVPDLMAIMVECNDSFRIEMGYIEALNESGSFPDEIDRTPKCYVRCVLENTGVASEDGKFDPAQAALVFAGERNGKLMNDIQDLATMCAERKETCKCERSYQFMKCLMEAEIKEYA